MKVSIFLAAIFTVALCLASPVAAQESPGDVVLTVNEEPVYSWEIALLMPQVQQEMARQGMQPDQEMVVRASMQRVVDSKLLAQEARRQELKPNEQRVKETLAQIETQAGGREKLDEALSQRGMTYQMLETSVIESDLVRVFIESKIDPTISVTPENVETYYNENPQMFQQPEQVHARHILTKTGPDATEVNKAAAQAKAVAARKRALAGEDFATLAIELSEGPSAPQGGDLGFFAREQMVAPFADAAFALDVGQISEVVETQFGYHVIKVEEKRPASTMTLEQVRQPLEQMLRQNQGAEATNEVIEKLAEAATITQVGGGAAPAEAVAGDE
jgi:peptidyl-prolyl cis-trans isomerase C